MNAGAPKIDWNELQFLSWGEFKQMTPSILGLEVTRLGKVIQSFSEDTEFHNSLVRARYSLEQFIACLSHARKETVEDTCAGHLREAIMHASFQSEGLDEATRNTCRYILDRLNYVYKRIALIY